ncbi:ephexin-1 [Dermacentor andersoni]|uniref:ephexin-1 n=1 Tax=Dermacentor andersoni TaxID=34620 RepID=UPI00241714A8|nr:ephexin-1-like [Dermacentor andersoni]XP_050040384.2 ephexin-1-like [Dermacentor andersoni]XP_054929423.1 ephexin-1-like [Dermacentor andersoni]
MSGERLPFTTTKPEAAVLPVRRTAPLQQDVRSPVRLQVPGAGNLPRPKVVPRPGSRVASIAKSFEQLSLAEPTSVGRRATTVANRRSFRATSGIVRPSAVRRTHSVLTQQKPLTAVQVAVRNLEARCTSPAPRETLANHSFLWTRDEKELQYGGSLSSACGDTSKNDPPWCTAESDKPYEDITWEMVDDSSSSSTTYEHLYEPIYDVLDHQLPGNQEDCSSDIRVEISSHCTTNLPKESTGKPLGDSSRRRPLATFYVQLSVDGAATTTTASGTGSRPQRRRRLRRMSAVPRRPQSPPPLPPTAAAAGSSPPPATPCPETSDGRLLEEEPLYQFYQQAVVQQACQWGSVDGDEPCGQRTLWRELPQVRASGVLEQLTDTEQHQHEALFEVLTSEASYQRSLRLLTDHFAPGLHGTLEPREWDALFGSLGPLREASERLLARLDQCWDGPLLCEQRVCSALQEHASQHGAAYVRYCSHQGHQERLLRELSASRPDVAARLRDLEAAPDCQGLRLHSFLLLPMQRVTRLPLLADALLRHAPDSRPARDALGALNQVVADCNEGARKMARMEEMLHVSRTLEFRECRAVPLISSSRWLVKRGPLVRVSLDSRRRTWGRLVQCARTSLHLFLFTDLLLVTKRKGDDYYAVLDHCPRNMLQACAEAPATLPSRLPDCCRHLFQLTLLQNSAGRTVEMLLAAESESDKTRWMDVLTPMVSSDPDERIYEEWDCPQVQCRHAYTPRQPDELALEEADVVNVFRKMSDGWYEGERLRDGARGWFPASHTVELVNLHVRSRNLRLRYRLLMASQTLLEQQQFGKSDA